MVLLICHSGLRISDVCAHRFRHTLAKELLERGILLEMVAAILGNTAKVCEKHYSHWVESRQLALETNLGAKRSGITEIKHFISGQTSKLQGGGFRK